MVIPNCWEDGEKYDFESLTESLYKFLKIKSLPIGMKRFKSEDELNSIKKIRRPDPAQKMATDQIVGQCRWIGWTIGITADNLMGAQCGAVVGLHKREGEFLSGQRMAGVWYGSIEDSKAHQAAMDCASYGEYYGLAVSPLASGRLDNPDICLIYGTPGQMITLINGLQYRDYEKYEFSVVGESACADSWGRALSTGRPSLSIPCYAERKFGGVLDEELLMALPPSYLPKLVEGLAALSSNGLRYPIPNHGIEKSPMESIGRSYGDR
ncbi:MAG: DUF169 domain-containing protein [Pseudomonadota bacterium]|nr:DUF169 domain-containing protein [Pseudomonadota bacterium]